MSIIAKNILIGGEKPKPVEEVSRPIGIFEKIRKQAEPVSKPVEKIKPIPEIMIAREVPSKEIETSDDYHVVQDGILEKKYNKKSSYLSDMVDLKII